VPAVLDEDHDDDARIVDRRERREPRMVREKTAIDPFAENRVAPRDLNGPGLAPASTPGTREPKAVPPGSLTTAHIPFFTIARSAGSIASDCRGWAR
jgi:hypothetical protein